MKRIQAVIRASKFDEVREDLHKMGVEFFIFYDVKGVTFQSEQKGSYRGTSIYDAASIPRRALEVVVPEIDAKEVIECIKKAARTGSAGDGKIFISDVEEVIRIV